MIRTCFCFGNYEGLRERLGVTKSALVPDALGRTGRLRGIANPVNVHQAVVPYLDLFPLPNDGLPNDSRSGQYRFSQEQPTRGDYVTGKFDWNASAKYSFFGRYTSDDSAKLRQDDKEDPEIRKRFEAELKRKG